MTHTPLYRAFSWSLVLILMGTIFYWSSQSTIPIPSYFPNEDKLLHFSCYALLAFLTAHALQGSFWRRFLIASLFASLYGASDEFHQYFVPGRDCDFWDWFADSWGALAGAYLFLRTEVLWRKPRPEV